MVDRFPVKDSSIFVTSPNTSGAHLEEELGLDYPHKPAMVELSLRNKITLARHEGLAWVFLSSRKNFPGFYKHQYHAFFVHPHHSHLMFTGLHENMHGFQASKNPLFRPDKTPLAEAIKWRAKEDFPYSKEHLERCLIIDAFAEGLCHWAAVKAEEGLVQKGLVTEGDLFIDNNSIAYLALDFVDGEQPDQYLARQLIRYLQQADQLLTTLPEHSLQASRAAIAALQDIDKCKYVAGLQIVLTTMNSLLGRGLPMGRAIEEVVMHPPTSLDDFRNPQRYLKRLASTVH